MAKATKKKRDTIADEMLAGMQAFARDLKRLPEEKSMAKYRRRAVEVKWAPREYDAKGVKGLRSSMECSQQVFAEFISVSAGTLRNWEQGVRPVRCNAQRQPGVEAYLAQKQCWNLAEKSAQWGRGNRCAYRAGESPASRTRLGHCCRLEVGIPVATEREAGLLICGLENVFGRDK